MAGKWQTSKEVTRQPSNPTEWVYLYGQPKDSQVQHKTTVDNRTSDTMSTPLTMKIATATWRFKTFEKQGQKKLHTGLDMLNDYNGTRTNIAEAEIVTGVPDEIFTNIEDVNKNWRNTKKFISTETKKNMTTEERWRQRRTREHQKLQPR